MNRLQNALGVLLLFSAGTALAQNTFPASGNVGVGTTTPAYKLQVDGGASSGSFAVSGYNGQIGFAAYADGSLIGPTSGLGTAAALSIVPFTVGRDGLVIQNMSGQNGGYPLRVNDANGNGLFNVQYSGNVGIGTTAPAYSLDVAGQVHSSGGIVFPDGSVQTTATGQTLSGSNAITQSNGSVGIGTSSPGAKLQIEDTPGWVPYTTYQLQLTTNGYKNADQPPIPVDSAALSFYPANYAVGGAGSWARTLDIRVRGAADGAYGMGVIRLFANPVTSGAAETEIMRVQGNGNVGIGTTAPGAKLEVSGNVKLTAGSGASLTFQDGTVQSTAWTGTACGGDYAESVDVSGDRTHYGPGDVLVIDPTAEGNFLKSAEPYSTSVTGIYSTKPGLVGRRQLTDKSHMKDEVPMAMTGIVPTKVSAENGPIKAGDLLVSSSTLGYAMKGTDRSRMLGAVIGKALGHLDSGTGVIEVVVTLQ